MLWLENTLSWKTLSKFTLHKSNPNVYTILITFESGLSLNK